MSTDTTADDIIDLLRQVRGVGQKTAEALVEEFDADVDRLLEASVEELTEADGVGLTTARAIHKRLRVLDEYGLQVPIESFEYDDRRPNIPTDQLSQLLVTDADELDVTLYPRNPELDPQLVWQGKDHLDGDDLAVHVVPVYIQEKVVPQAIVENFRRTPDNGSSELTLFEDFDGLDDADLLDFYEHDANWSNRFILGDALVAMTSLAEKENLKGQVQTIYVDPPYGIKFQSNWQVSTRDRSVTDGKDISRQPEQIRAFRDTWKHGIHSYLTYLRDRLQVAHTLLKDTGSIFVQISDDNVHMVRSLLDEVFGSDNFVSLITFQKTTSATSETLGAICDYLVWYARDRDRMKYRQLYRPKELGGEGTTNYNKVLLPDGTERGLSRAERAGVEPVPEGARIFTADNLMSSRPAREGDVLEFEHEGRTYTPMGGTFKTNQTGLERLQAAGRLYGTDTRLYYIRFLDDFGVFPLANLWTDVTASFMDKVYVVQTNVPVVERCILMTSDPGDLVLDPTCGSGTTAYAAEKWGRRWITMDTSRVALALARARVMGARYPFWLLADTREGARQEAEELGRDLVEPADGYGGDIRKGFVYRRALHVMLSTVANCDEIEPGMSRADAEAAIRRCAESEVLYDQPYEDKNRVRVAGPFTVESLSPHRTLDPALSVSEGDAGNTAPNEDHTRAEGSDVMITRGDFGETVLDNLKRAGVQNGYRDERLEFDRLEPYPDGGWVAATGSFTDDAGDEHLVAVSVGPEHGTVGRDQVNNAAREAVRLGADILLVCGFAFDGGATDEAADASSRDFPVVGDRQVGRVRVLNVRVNADLMMDEELKSTGSGNLFMVFGEPDIEVAQNEDGLLTVKLRGVDVYDPVKNEVRSSGAEDAMAWFIDTDYDENQFFVRHAYFTGNPSTYDPYVQLKRALKAEIDLEAWSQLHSTESLPFEPPSTGKIAVKVINHYGDEVLKVFHTAEVTAAAA